MGAYGQSDLRAGADVRFPFDLALQAARNAWRLAQELRSTAEGIRHDATTTMGPWVGPKRDEFDERWPVEDRKAQSVADGFERIALGFAEAWSRARGEQDRINHSRDVAARAAVDRGGGTLPG